MEYQVLTIGLTDELFSGIQAVLTSNNLCLTPAVTIRDASCLLEQQIFQLLVVDLEYLRNAGRTDWLSGIRRISFIPIIVLSDNPEQDTRPMVQLGADICVSGKGSYPMITDGSITDSLPFRGTAAKPPEPKRRETMSLTEMESYRELILENIEYDCLKQRFGTYREDLDEIVELLVETVCAKRKTTRIPYP